MKIAGLPRGNPAFVLLRNGRGRSEWVSSQSERRSYIQLTGIWITSAVLLVAVQHLIGAFTLLSVPSTARAAELPADTPGTVSYVNFDVLVGIYTGPTARGQWTAAQVQGAYADMDATRWFYWRNSRGVVNLTLTFLEIDESKSETDYDGLGLKASVVADDLRERGIANDQYDVIVGVAPGNGYFGRGQALGLGSTLYSTGVGSFVLIHELHHALEHASNVSGFDYLDVHPNFVGIYGGNYDVNAYIFRTWPARHWFELREPWGTTVTTADADGDGLADNDPQAVLDEARFGTNSSQADTDGDGLSDLGEVSASRQSSGNPLQQDTDADGIPDGGDSYPTYAVQTWIPRYTPTINGTIEAAWPRFYHNASQNMTTYAAWDPTGLHVAVRMTTPRRFTIVIDANHDGWLRGPTGDPVDSAYNTIADNYEVVIDPIERRVVAAHARNPETAIWAGAPWWDETSIQPSDIVLALNASGTEVELTIPTNTAAYLVPSAGRPLGITLHSANQWYFDPEHLVEVTLADAIPSDLASPPLPALISPADGYTPVGPELSLEWSPVVDIGSSGLQGYELQVDDQPTFESPLASVLLMATRHTLTLPANGTYYWRVRANDYVGNSSAFTASRVIRYLPIPPTAVLTANHLDGAAPLAVEFDGDLSLDPDGTLVSYDWDFGDGVRVSGPTASHTYTSAGTYTARLKVTDNDGLKAFDAAAVTVGVVEPEVLVSLRKPATASSIGGAALPSYANDGDIADGTRVWDAGTDNAGEWWQVDLGKIYDISRVTVYAWAVNGHDWYSRFHIDVSTTGAFAGEQVTVATEANWDLTRGPRGWVSYPIASVAAGRYVRVTADMAQMWTKLQELEVFARGSSVANQPPRAIPNADPMSGPAPLDVQFDASGSSDPDGTLISYAWDFGDGAIGLGPNISHVYPIPGSYVVRLTVTDDGGLGATESLEVTIQAPPVLTPIGNRVVDENQLLAFTVAATDPDSAVLSFQTPIVPAGASFVPMGDVTFDGALTIVDAMFIAQHVAGVTPLNPAQEAVADVDGDGAIEQADADLIAAIVVGTQAPRNRYGFVWRPTFDQAGLYPVTFTVNDGVSEDSETITVTVRNVNRPPVLDLIPDQTVHEGELLEVTVNATDPDGDVLTYRPAFLIIGMNFQNQTLTWTPTYEDAGTYEITIRVSDGPLIDPETITVEGTFTITVLNVNRPPLALLFASVISGPAPLAVVFIGSGTDPEGDTLTYAWSFGDGESASDRIATHTYTTPGIYTASLTVSDGLLQSTASVTITVQPAVDSMAPTVTITSPLGGWVSRRSIVPITASASDNVGVTRVEFFVNGSLECIDADTPYSCAWLVPVKKWQKYTLEAHAYDAQGNVGKSSLVSVISK